MVYRAGQEICIIMEGSLLHFSFYLIAICGIWALSCMEVGACIASIGTNIMLAFISSMFSCIHADSIDGNTWAACT